MTHCSSFIRGPSSRRSGTYRRSWATVRPATQPYWANIRADKDGGRDRAGQRPTTTLYRIDSARKLWQSLHVAGPKGEKFRLYDQFAVDPEGRIWASDHSRLFRIGDDGRADLSLGGPPEGTLGEPVRLLAIDDKGWMCTRLENGTAAVHVFDENGKPQQRHGEAGADGHDDAGRAVVDRRGKRRSAFAAGWALRHCSDIRCVMGSAWAWRCRPEPWNKHGPGWEPVRGGGWEVGSDRARRAQRGWLAGVGSESSGRTGNGSCPCDPVPRRPDGSLALLCTRETRGGWFLPATSPACVCVFGPDGQGRGALVKTSIPMLFDQLFYDGKHVFLSDSAGVTVIPVPLTGEGKRYQCEMARAGSVEHLLASRRNTGDLEP